MCGLNAQCQIVNHNPICSCLSGFTGDPFVRCFIEESKFQLIEFTYSYILFHDKPWILITIHFYRTNDTNQSLHSKSLWSTFSMQRN